MTGRLLWLPAALKGAGLKVNVVGGWETRGRPVMNPRGLVLHHTASRQGSNAPSLRVCIDGRPDLPGPLCQILVGRDLTCHVIASGLCYHAGTGNWRGLAGNASVIGVECENDGVSEPWSQGMVETMVRIAAACAMTAGFSSEMVCGHKEWAPRRKVDPHSLSLRDIRLRVASLLTPRMSEEDEIVFTVAEAADYVREAYDQIVERPPTDYELYIWAHAIAADAREMWKMQQRLIGEAIRAK